jgi:hypothetical protein
LVAKEITGPWPAIAIAIYPHAHCILAPLLNRRGTGLRAKSELQESVASAGRRVMHISEDCLSDDDSGSISPTHIFEADMHSCVAKSGCTG